MLLHTPFFDLQPYSRLVSSIIPESVSVEEELKLFRKFMSSTLGIIFPSNCFCYDPIILALVREGKQILLTIFELVNQNKIEEALAADEKLFDIRSGASTSLGRLRAT